MNNESITINAKGSAESRFTRASFYVSAVCQGDTGPQAKERVQPLMKAIQGVLAEQGEKAAIDLSRVKTTFSVAPHETYQGNNRVMNGYAATYTLAFSCSNILEALAVHDQLTNIPGIRAETPVFHMDNEGRVAAEAFKDAYEKAQDKFEAQCSAVGSSHQYWRLVSWSIQDEEPRGKMLSFKATNGTATAGAEPGKAMFDVGVRFTYALKTRPGT